MKRFAFTTLAVWMLLAATSIAADVAVELTLSTTEANLVIEADETLKIALTIAGTQGSFSVEIDYKLLEVSDYAGAWPALPKG